MVDRRKSVKVDPILARAVFEARDAFERYLGNNGIHDRMIIKIRRFSEKHKRWIALYRSMSRFNGEVIIWINVDFRRILRGYDINPMYTITDIITDSLLHEYAHVIFEWAAKRDPVLLNMIITGYTNEEEFAEHMIETLKSDGFIRSHDDILNRFVTSVFGDE